MRYLLAALALAAAGRGGAQEAYAPPSGDPKVEASIRAQNDVLIPAEVEGVLTQFPALEGATVKAGDVLAMIDDQTAKAAVEVAQISLDAARERATDDIEKKYAVAASDVAKTNWMKVREANQGFANAVPEIDIRQKKLEYARSVLQIEKAGKDMVIASKEADVKAAELRANQIALNRRTIAAPFDGQVQRLFRHKSEWVNPGDPILRLVQFDVLYVEALIDSTQYDPADLMRRRATVQVNLARDRTVRVEGMITYVDQTVDADGRYIVRAEIQNQQTDGVWLVRPGLNAEMTIHMSEAPAEAQSASVGP